jgi:hypothetical protein
MTDPPIAGVRGLPAATAAGVSTVPVIVASIVGVAAVAVIIIIAFIISIIISVVVSVIIFVIISILVSIISAPTAAATAISASPSGTGADAAVPTLLALFFFFLSALLFLNRLFHVEKGQGAEEGDGDAGGPVKGTAFFLLGLAGGTLLRVGMGRERVKEETVLGL